MYTSNKLCEKCKNGIRMNITTIIRFYTLIVVIAVVSLLFVLWFYNLIVLGIWAVFVISLNFLIPYILARFFKQGLFLSKTDGSS